MSEWTYSGNPGNNLKDQVRFLIGDTRDKQPMLLDGEIEWVLGQYNGDPLSSAIRCCEVLIANSATLVNQSVGSVSYSLGDRIKNLAQIVLPTLTARLAMEGIQVYGGGLSISEKRANNQNSDLVHAQFSTRIFDPRGFSIGPICADDAGNYYRDFP